MLVTYFAILLVSGYEACIFFRPPPPPPTTTPVRLDIKIECMFREQLFQAPTTTVSSSCKCGQSQANRIVGGTNAAAGEFPWQIGLEK